MILFILEMLFFMFSNISFNSLQNIQNDIIKLQYKNNKKDNIINTNIVEIESIFMSIIIQTMKFEIN